MDAFWKLLGSRTIVQDRWLDLRADTCLTPSGVAIDPYYVMSCSDWINVVAITKDERLLLVRQYRHAAGRFFLEIPGGSVEASDRDGEDAARRELIEETGYAAGNWTFVATLYPNPASQTNRLHIYLATDAEPVALQTLDQGEEGLTVCTLPIAEILDGMRTGLIEQALHVSSIFLALQAAGRLG